MRDGSGDVLLDGGVDRSAADTALLKFLITCAGDLFLRLDAAGRIVESGGKRQADLVRSSQGGTFLALVLADDRPGVERELGALIRGEKGSATFECRMASLAGRPLVYKWTLCATGIDDTRAVAAFGLDNTETAGLLGTPHVLNAIVENIPAMIFLKEARELRFALFNRAGEELLGFPRQDMLGKNDYDFFPPDQADQFTSRDRETLAGTEMVEILEEPLRTKGGKIAWLHTKKVPVRDAFGNALYLLGISLDITQRKRMEDALRESHERLKEFDRLKTDFFANVSHELRTPLALILGPTEKLLAAPDVPPMWRRDLDTVARNARVLLKQVNDLLDISRLEAGRLSPRYSRIDLARLVRVVASNFETVAKGRSLGYSVEAPQALMAECDPDMIERILANLLGNAIKFTPRGGSILCELRPGEGEAAIAVSDSGPGVPVEFQEAIFERFRQVEGGAARQFGGTGLGLAIAREFAELHHGRISVDRAPQGGARFTVFLPLEAPPGSELVAPPPELEACEGMAAATATGATRGIVEGFRDFQPAPGGAVCGSGPLVLIVEDHPEMSRYLAEALADSFSTAIARDGSEGLAMALELRPDVILSDVMMPGMSGDRMVVELRKHLELDGTPILMLTAKADADLRVTMLSAGAQDYLLKPFSLSEIRAKVAIFATIKRTRDLLQQELASKVQDVEALAGDLAKKRRHLEREIADRKEAEDRLRQSAREVEDLYNSAPCGYHSLDRDGLVIRMNDTEIEWLGYGREEVVGKMPFTEFLTSAGIQAFGARFPELMERGWIRDIEVDLVRRDGTTFPVLISSKALFDAAGKFVMTHTTVYDMSERKAFEEHREEERRHLEQIRHLKDLDALKDEFVSMLSHDLRSPLQAFMGFGSLLEDEIAGPLNETQRDYLGRMLATAETTLALVNDLLDLSRFQAGKLKLDRRIVDLGEVVENVMDHLSVLTEKKHLRSTTVIEANLPLVFADESRLAQVVSNLVGNALKFTPEGGTIDVRVLADRDGVLCEVSDTGRGISPEDQSRLFGRFTRVGPGDQSGAGLGLSICKSLIEAHGGTIGFRSQLGEGSTFWFRLPPQTTERS